MCEIGLVHKSLTQKQFCSSVMSVSVFVCVCLCLLGGLIFQED